MGIGISKHGYYIWTSRCHAISSTIYASATTPNVVFILIPFTYAYRVTVVTQYAKKRRYQYFSNVSPGHLTRWNSIKTKTRCVDYYYSTLLVTVIHIVDLSNNVIFSSKYKNTCTVVLRLWLSAVIQEDQESFDVFNQACKTCCLHFEYSFFV